MSELTMLASSTEPREEGGDAPLVTVAISTLGEGVRRINLPQAQEGICYMILLQRLQKAALEIPAVLAARRDVEVVPLDNLGLSNSRNAALTLGSTPLLLFADDDQALDTEGILQLAQAFSHDPDLALAAGWRAERMPERVAPLQKLTRFNSGRICAPEFMIDLERIRDIGLCFDPEFGLGARQEVGEDYIFVCDVLSAGLKGAALPVVTGSHPHESTGDNWSDPKIMNARRAMLARVFGVWAPLIRLAYGVKHWRRFGSSRRIFAFVLG